MSQKNTGGSVDYYSVEIKAPTTEGRPRYIAECNDIIEALGMNYAEGNAFKAIWRKAAARTLGIKKAGYDEGLYDSEKTEFFGKRMKVQALLKLRESSKRPIVEDTSDLQYTPILAREDGTPIKPPGNE